MTDKYLSGMYKLYSYLDYWWSEQVIIDIVSKIPELELTLNKYKHKNLLTKSMVVRHKVTQEVVLDARWSSRLSWYQIDVHNILDGLPYPIN